MDRRPSAREKALIVLLTVYAVGGIGPDTLRVFPFVYEESDSLKRWYPLGTLGFQADNDGNIKTIEPGSAGLAVISQRALAYWTFTH